jgi:hypothetical protein
VARIRSIKPEFFTSEIVASLALSARLTFIGLWTYVDDNGVGLDNERLIIAAVWPLEEDVAETAYRTREDLRSLTGACLVTRYGDGRRRFIHISSWTEHQKVSHPRKPRYPLPTEPGVTCANHDPPEPSGATPENLRSRSALSREQGAGSREQGVPPAAGAASPANAGLVVAAYVEGAQDAGQPRPAASLRARVGKQARELIAEGYSMETLIPAARKMGAGEWNDLAVQVRKDAATTNGRPSTTDQRIAAIQSLKTTTGKALT